jgi:hypothetical protein
MKSAKIMTVVAALGLLSASAFATTVGYVKNTVTGLNLLSIPFEQSPTVTGTFTAVSGNTLTDTGAFASLDASTTPSVVRITSGTNEGVTFIIDSNTSDALTVSSVTVSSADSVVSVSDTYAVYNAETLDTYFASTTLTAGATATAGDAVFIWNGSFWVNYFYSTTVSPDGWVLSSNTSTDVGATTILAPESTFLFVKQGSGDVITSGTVADGKASISLPVSGLVVLGNQIPTDTTLAGLGIETNAGWADEGTASGLTKAQADQVFIWNGSFWNSYYYDGDDSQWKNVTNDAVSGTEVIAGVDGVLVARNGNGTLFTFTQEL